ncbi:methylenetetrahydrofolate reductase [Actinomyces radicidentis]|uniref:methylenetetrahydrofolate reductase n=1 Tax=Actinomyces radicidentis TaxID=111015 RepID=UPI0028E3DE4B|nr:methylenetetrahydrofolate reductase [Actinomyces radicidentis]
MTIEPTDQTSDADGALPQTARPAAPGAVPAPHAPQTARPAAPGAVPAPHAPQTARPSLSLELFPPRPGRHVTQTWGALDRLLATGPDFVSVTYRPSFVIGGTGTRTAGSGVSSAASVAGAAPPVRVRRERNPAEDVVAHVLSRSDVPLMAHLTCIGYRRDSVVEIVRRFLDLGVRRFLALRGDPPRGRAAEDVAGELPHADDLVRVIREVESDYFGDGTRHTQIAVAAYPADIDHGTGVEVLGAKQAAGADLAITQVFYDPEDYLALRRAALYSGVTMPILPGIIPLTDLRRLTRLEALTGVGVPPDLVRTLERSDGAAAAAAGIDATLNLASAVLDGGAPGVHLYTFNRVRPALDVISHLRLGGILTGSSPDTAVQREVRRDYLNATPGGDRGPSGRMPGAARS